MASTMWGLSSANVVRLRSGALQDDVSVVLCRRQDESTD